MIQQCFNLFIVKARLGFPYGPFMFANKMNFMGIMFGAIFVFAIIYIPPINVIGTSWRLSPLIWLAPIVSGSVLYIYSILRIIIIRSRKLIIYFFRKSNQVQPRRCWASNVSNPMVNSSWTRLRIDLNKMLYAISNMTNHVLE